MIKQRNLSVYKDHKTGLFFKISIIFGILLLFIGLVFRVSSTTFLSQANIDAILAFSIIFIFVGLILYFFHYQFLKLSEIAEEIEKEHDA